MAKNTIPPVGETAGAEAARGAALMIDGSGTICDVSEPASVLLGRQVEELLGSSLASLAIHEEQERLARAVVQAWQSGILDTDAEIVVGDGRRRLGFHGRMLAGGRMLVLLQNQDRYFSDTGTWRPLLDNGPRIAAATTPAELWSRIWDAIHVRLPEAVALRVYRGDEAAVRLIWSSDLPPDTKLVLTVRGWGPKLLAMLEDPKRFEAFATRFKESSRGHLGRFLRFVSGYGSPMLLDDPDEQLGVFLNEEELQKVSKFRPPGGKPGQEIMCPLVTDGRAELVGLVVGPPDKHPFTWDDAEEVWQLILLGREVAKRLELDALASQYEGLTRLYRGALLEMARAEKLTTLYSRVGGELLRGTGADGIAVLTGPRGGRIEWFRNLDEETCGEIQKVVEGIVGRTGEHLEPVFLASAGADELVADLGVRLRGVGAMAIVPAYLGGARLATLILTWPEPRGFSPAERALVEFLSVGFALALSNHRVVWRLGRIRERVRRIASVVGHGLLELDAAGRIRFISPLAVRLLGITDVEARGKAFLSVVAPKLGEQLSPILGQVLQRRAVDEAVIIVDKRSLRIHVIVDEGAGDDDDEVLSMWALREESEAEHHRARLDKLFSSTSEIIMDLAPDGTVLGVNAAGERFLKQVGALRMDSSTASPPRRIWRVLRTEDLEALRRGETVRKSGERARPGGVPLAWEAEFQPLETSGELRILGTVRDRTERHALATARSTLQQVWDAVLALQGPMTKLGDVIDRSHNLATAVMIHSSSVDDEGAGGQTPARAREAMWESARRLAQEAAGDRQVILEIEGQLAGLQDVLQGAVGVAGRCAWIITDQLWRGDAVVQELERTGWSCLVVLPNDPMTQDILPEPSVVVLDVGSLTMAVDLYGMIRRMHRTSGILLAAPLGGAAAQGLSEDPCLRIVDSIPAGPELQELVNQVCTSPAGASRNPRTM